MKLPFLQTIQADEVMAPRRGLIISRAPGVNGKRGMIVSVSLVLGVKAPWWSWFDVDFDMNRIYARPMAWARTTVHRYDGVEFACGVMAVDEAKPYPTADDYPPSSGRKLCKCGDLVPEEDAATHCSEHQRLT
ncbi:MAG TPA: hypothetical protein VLE97_01940 [Gaiellaceae bacterium]|nr:hypothetical protein [Gaiellaceae bacterium]